MKENKESLKRVVGVFGFSTNIINIVVGSGIFVLPAIIAAGLGSSSIFAYLLCGFLVALVMLCFAEAGSRVADSGGVYSYIRRAFGPYFGFLTSVLFVLASISSDAAVANAIVDIIGSIIPEFEISYIKILTFFILFAGFGFVNIKGVRNGVKVVKFITITKLIPLLLLILFSWGNVSFENLSIGTISPFNDIAKVSLILFFAFQGAEAGLSISGEVINPKRNIPKGIFSSTIIILILYILIQIVSQGVLGDSLATFKENPLGAVANQVFGPVGFTIMTVAAAVSMLGCLSSSILSMPRMLFRASKDNVLPIKPLTKIHSKFSTPYISIICYASAGFLFASIGGFEQLAIISSATILLIYLGVSLSVVKLRKLNIGSGNEFRIPGGYLIPILSSLIILYLLSNLARNEFIIILIAIIILTVVYFLKTKLNKK
ncbi:MAG: amino acid permease [Flavobacteriaceae bacterium]